MEMPVAGWGKIKNYEQEIAAADYPGIRLFQVKKHTSVAPLDAYQVESTMGGWKECSPSTVPEFSAVAYLYARELHQKLNVPVGVIDCTWGGTPAEAWTSSESLKQVMGYQKKVGKLEALGFDRDKIMAEYGKEQASWKAEISKIDKGYQNGKACWVGENVDDNDWQQMELPGYWEGKGLPNFDGVVWFRKQIEVPADWAGKDLQLNPGTIDDEDIVYWNGEQIASGAGYKSQRQRRRRRHCRKSRRHESQTFRPGFPVFGRKLEIPCRMLLGRHATGTDISRALIFPVRTFQRDGSPVSGVSRQRCHLVSGMQQRGTCRRV